MKKKLKNFIINIITFGLWDLFKETDNTYTCWVVVEMGTKSILEGASNQISKDKKLEVNYDQKKFAEEVEREKEKMSKEQ